MFDVVIINQETDRERRDRLHAEALKRYNAAYNNDHYHRVTSYFKIYMPTPAAITACNLLIDTCIDRCAGINRGFADVELRQLIFKNIDGVIWCDCKNELNAYLQRFTV